MRNCPFCGSGNVKLTGRDTSAEARYYTGRKPKVYVRCTTCNARGPIARTPQEAEAKWDVNHAESSPLLAYGKEVGA